jgi:hypothetical protein
VGKEQEGGLQYFLNTQEVEKREGSVKEIWEANIKQSKKVE